MAAYRYRPAPVPRHAPRRGDGRGLLAAAVVATALAGAGAGLSAAGPVSQGSAVQLGARMAATAPYYWTGGQWTCLDELWTRESGWQTDQWNTQGSGAYGIPQALPADKMAAAGADYMTDPVTQIRWGLGYIAQAYGSPCTAWDHETAFGWY